MTRLISRDNIEDALVGAGVKSPYARARLMRLIEAYAHKYPEPPPLPEPGDGYEYLCRKCGERKRLPEFPEYKRYHRRSPVPCNDCVAKENP